MMRLPAPIRALLDLLDDRAANRRAAERALDTIIAGWRPAPPRLLEKI